MTAAEATLELRSAVPGRQRWRIRSLQSRPQWAGPIERALEQVPGVLSASANPDTGRLLVICEPSVSAEHLRQSITAALPVSLAVAKRQRQPRRLETASRNGHLSLLSATPGRLRFRAPVLQSRPLKACAVEQALSQQVGILSVTANPSTGRLLIRHAPGVTVEEVTAQVESALKARPLSAEELALRKGAAPTSAEERMTARIADLKQKLAVGGGALAFLGAQRVLLGSLGGPLTFLIGTAATVVTGISYLRGAMRTYTGRGKITNDTLVGTATVASLMMNSSGSALVVIWLLNMGEYLEALTLQRTRREIRDLLAMDDGEVWRLEDGVESRRPIGEIVPGDTVAVYAGERVPVDGFVIAGRATINEAPITGESMPAVRTVDDQVYAGTVMTAGQLRVRVDKVGSDTAVGRLIQRVEEAQELKPSIQRLGDQFSKHFMPVAFGLAIATFVVTRSPGRALSMLLIACPCASGLATPTSMTAAIGNSARRGILIKGGTHLEAAAHIDTIVFDKTGTLTLGRPGVERIVPLRKDLSEEQVLTWAACAEQHSQHPVAMAVAQEAERRGLAIPPHGDYEEHAGKGIRADCEGSEVLVGNGRLLEAYGTAVTKKAEGLHRRYAAGGETMMYVALDRQLIGLIGVRDTIRPEARTAIDRLRSAGVSHLLMLTGDTEATAKSVAEAVGLTEWRSRLLPDEKFDVIRALQSSGRKVAMVGDGINDAPALALADVGIAMGTGGSDVAIEAADIALAADNLEHVAATIQLSRKALRIVRENYTMALGINAGGMVIGAFGALSPLLAAALHSASSVAVVLNSGRLIRYDITSVETTVDGR
jgi:cation-transporting P-type ATPase C